RYVALAGAPVRLDLGPPDTALYVGNTFTLRTDIRDRAYNRRFDPVAFEAAPTANVTSAGQVSGPGLARTFVRGISSGLIDTTWVSIVPRGTIVAGVGCNGI